MKTKTSRVCVRVCVCMFVMVDGKLSSGRFCRVVVYITIVIIMADGIDCHIFESLF